MLDPDSERLQPTWRKPAGIIALLVALALYAGLVAHLAQMMAVWPVWAQTVAYLVLGTVWLLPLRRFLIWMETGRWS
jgi:membrane protein YdbS with pleckstrin-like domain